MIDVERARADTPAVEDLDYFYSCGAGLMPQQVLDALHGHLDLEARIGGHAAEDEARPRLRSTYASIARLLNCFPEEIAFVENATVVWRQAFHGLAQDMERGDNIVTVIAEYASNFIAFLQTVNRRGAEIVAADRYELDPTARRYENWEGYVAGKVALGVAVDYALSFAEARFGHENRECGPARHE